MVAVERGVGGDAAWVGDLSWRADETWFRFADRNVVDGACGGNAIDQVVDTGRNSCALKAGRAVATKDFAVLQCVSDGFFECDVTVSLKIRIFNGDGSERLLDFIQRPRFKIGILNRSRLIDEVIQIAGIVKIDWLGGRAPGGQ